MNRKERRAEAARTKNAPLSAAESAHLIGEATRAYRSGRSAAAEALCAQILGRQPTHTPAINLLGLLSQASGRHREAIKLFNRALAIDDLNAACHYNIAASYQVASDSAGAATHFKRALALGMSDKVVESFIMQNPDVAACAKRTMEESSLPVTKAVLGNREISALAKDVFLRCVLQTNLIRGVELEFLLSHLRFALARVALDPQQPIETSDDTCALLCALAQQCFINGYAFVQGDAEAQQADRLRELLSSCLSSRRAIQPVAVAAVASYFPLHHLIDARSLLEVDWPSCVGELLVQQIREPLEEAEDCKAIPALTTIDDAVSIAVMRQYEENPYPPWTSTSPAIVSIASDATVAEASGQFEREEILVAGCGTGQHAFHVAQQWPRARVLAIDISRPSLAYARRKTREAGLGDLVEYAQADILSLAAIDRRFDRIEAVGVLHHLADPEVGWRALLLLLKPGGVLRVGLYSAAARRSIVEARAIIAERGYQPTPSGIRALRQEIIRNRHEPRWKMLLASADDFYSTSGCRDLFFNMMEHRYTIPQIAALLRRYHLSFSGFELDADGLAAFARQYPGSAALGNLDYWHTFELANPQTFRHMYVFSVSFEQLH